MNAIIAITILLSIVIFSVVWASKLDMDPD